MVLNVCIYACMVFLTAACSGNPSDGLFAARAEPAQACTPKLPVDKGAGILRVDAYSDDETARMAQDLQNIQAELAAARKHVNEQQERTRQAIQAAQQARAQIEHLTRVLAALRRSEASKSREIVACKRISAELLAAKVALEQSSAAAEQLVAEGQQQQACALPQLIFKRSNALN